MDRRSPRAIQYSIKILLEYECWGLCGEVKKFMGAWKYDQTDIERLSLIIPLHEQRSGAVHGYPITTSDKRQTPACKPHYDRTAITAMPHPSRHPGYLQIHTPTEHKHKRNIFHIPYLPGLLRYSNQLKHRKTVR